VEKAAVLTVSVRQRVHAVQKRKPVGLHVVQLISPIVLMENAPLTVIRKIPVLLPLFVQKRGVALKGVI